MLNIERRWVYEKKQLCVRSDAKLSSHSPLEDFVGEAISLPLFSGG